ncbi:MAG: ATP-grasp domain-containing protein [Pseudomonadota bacterium]
MPTPPPPTPATPGRALILGDHRQSLVVARSLQHAGYEVTLGSSEAFSMLRHSRHVSATWRYPCPIAQPDRFDAALAGWVAASPSPALLFPVGDLEVAALAAREAGLPPRARVVMANREAVRLCHDKPALYEVARDAGLMVADYEVAVASHVDLAVARIGYPCVVKPASSVEDGARFKALVLHGPPVPPLSAVLRGQDWLAIVQRKTAGVRHNCQFVAHRGVLLAYLEQSVQRTTRADGSGYGVQGRSEQPDEQRRRACERLLAALDYSGAGCVQFLVDPAHGESWLLEINPRLDATCAVAAHCGYDLPRLAVHEALHRAGQGPLPQPLPAGYPAGRRAVWLTGDLRALLNELQARRIAPKQAPGWLARSVVACLRADLHLTFSWRDPQPALRALLELVGAPVWRRVRRLLPRRTG